VQEIRPEIWTARPPPDHRAACRNFQLTGAFGLTNGSRDRTARHFGLRRMRGTSGMFRPAGGARGRRFI